ncbi:uncharacterized protein [Syngnathus scovelli]|uniref:uncharacterized protein isoform X1 n=1 Tax=Syngnathus scovelli TaxID=161590 RepID=UPI00211032E3|nr:galectin-4 isoform X1 [Syngnathus scovelli]
MMHQPKEFFFLILLCFPLSRGQSECPKGWLDYGDKCYYFSSDTKTWREANAFCLSHDSKLTSILDGDEKDWLRTTFRQAKAWLGLTDEHTEGVWSWTDGSLFTESMANWGENQPNNYGEGKWGAHCGAMVTRVEGRWFNYDCDSTKANYICKRANPESIVAPKENQVLDLSEQQTAELVDHIAIVGKVVAPNENLVLDFSEQQAVELIDQIAIVEKVVVPKENQELNVIEQHAVELVTQMAIAGKVVPKPEKASKTETNPQPSSPGEVRCSRTVIMKRVEISKSGPGLSGKLVGGLRMGNIIIVKGKFWQNAKRFTINLAGDDGLFALQVSLRFNWLGDENVVVRNSLLSGQYGKEERQLASFPFVPGQFFEIRIQCDANSFHVTLNGGVNLDYKYRIGLDKIKRVSVHFDATLTDVTLI